MLKLVKQFEELAGHSSAKFRRRLDFGDIENALPKFNWDDVAYPVCHFLRDFEEIILSTKADESFKLLALRRSLTETGRVFLSTTTALNCVSLKKASLAEFDFTISRKEIYKMLAHRRWKKEEDTLHCYVLSMQATAKRADNAEQEWVDGIGYVPFSDDSTDNRRIKYHNKPLPK